MVFDLVEVEEASCSYPLILEDLLASAALWVVWEEPGSAERDYAGRGGYSGADILGERG